MSIMMETRDILKAHRMLKPASGIGSYMCTHYLLGKALFLSTSHTDKNICTVAESI